ncbi:hypothetical protein K7X08_035505 [Anisodus acutangulus]|uniref:Uncharacterized protein n=1 Tax=Anisodus acutangulus TaxID=402998 RepID=A0A9Q1R1X3_9SOLA|nr:hypothetical protein K7X08_035505 [Anisodus acutangulus]
MSVRCLFTLNKNHASKGGGTYIDKFRITMKKLTSSRKGGNYGWSMLDLQPYQVAMSSAPRLIPAYIEVTWRYSSHTALTLQLLVNDLSSSGSWLLGSAITPVEKMIECEVQEWCKCLIKCES